MSKPNIVWIYCDELRTDALGCYGHPTVNIKTPAIDAIADAGQRFSNCFCNSPVCVPSRTCLLTGLYPEDTGVYHNEGFWSDFKLDRPLITFPEVFAENGYQTATFGKTHIPRELTPWPWEIERMRGSLHREYFKDVNPEEMDLVSPPGSKLVIGGHYPGDRPYPGDTVTRNALNWLREAPEPYLLRVSFLQPHTPVLPPPPYDTLYDGADFSDEVKSSGPWSSAFERRFAEVCGGLTLTPEQRYQAQVAYYGMVAWIDTQVEQILAALEALGQLENTILLFEADHGDSLGEAGCIQKQIFAPQVHRVPRLLSWPAELPGGEVRSDICESLDIPRTLLSLASVDIPSQFKGRDLFSTPAPEAVYATIGFGHSSSRAFPNLGYGIYDNDCGWPRRACIRTDRYRLDRNVRINGKPADSEAFDLFLTDYQQDPSERNNLAAEPSHAEGLNKLSRLLDEHLAQSVEPPEVIII